jgi:hypothetical protein
MQQESARPLRRIFDLGKAVVATPTRTSERSVFRTVDERHCTVGEVRSSEKLHGGNDGSGGTISLGVDSVKASRYCVRTRLVENILDTTWFLRPRVTPVTKCRHAGTLR